MTNKPTPTDAEILDAAEDFRSQYTHGGTTFDEFDEIGFTRAVLAKWGQPAVAGEPFGYFHQLLNHEGKGNGVWLGAAERKVVEQAHTPGETSEEIVALYTTPQPTHAQAAEPVAWAFKYDDGTWHDPSTTEHSPGMRPLCAAPQPVARVPLDEARLLFDAGWKAAALFCDREDVVADGIIGFGACPQFEAAFSAANGIKGGQHEPKQMD